MGISRYDTFDVWRATLSYELRRKDVKVVDIAKKAEISRATIYNLESGKRKKAPDIEIMRAVAQALGYTYEDFLVRGRELIEKGGGAAEFPVYSSVASEVYGVDESGAPLLRPAAPAMGLIAAGYLEAAGVKEDDLWLFLMRTNVMIPHIHQGQVLFINHNDTKIQSGMAYLVLLGDELTVRYLENSSRGVWVRASPGSSINPLELVGEEAKKSRVFGRVLFQQGPAS